MEGKKIINMRFGCICASGNPDESPVAAAARVEQKQKEFHKLGFLCSVCRLLARRRTCFQTSKKVYTVIVTIAAAAAGPFGSSRDKGQLTAMKKRTKKGNLNWQWQTHYHHHHHLFSSERRQDLGVSENESWPAPHAHLPKPRLY
jgi:hypothetical protein